MNSYTSRFPLNGFPHSHFLELIVSLCIFK